MITIMFDKKAYNTKWYQEHKKEEAKKYQEHREERLKYAAEYRREHKEDHTAWRAAHHDEITQYAAEYNRTHREKIAKRNAARYKLQREEILKHNTQYQHEHLPEYAASNAKRRALIAGAIDNVTPEQLDEIKDIYRTAIEDPKVRCYLCGKLIPIGHRHVDHIIPLSKGGKHCPSNLAVACDVCNQHKSAKLPEEIGLLI